LGPSNGVEAVNKDADGYIIKPFQTEQLLTLIQQHLKKQREEDDYV
jgi:DNA-binding response OmpR family regulator